MWKYERLRRFNHWNAMIFRQISPTFDQNMSSYREGLVSSIPVYIKFMFLHLFHQYINQIAKSYILHVFFNSTYSNTLNIIYLKPVMNRVNSRHMTRSESTLAQVLACCLTAPSHYLNQCWLNISNVPGHSSESNFTRHISHQSLKISLKIT